MVFFCIIIIIIVYLIELNDKLSAWEVNTFKSIDRTIGDGSA